MNEFVAIDRERLNYHALYPLRLLELAKLSSYQNFFNCEPKQFELICKYFPVFGSTNLNTYIQSTIDAVKELRLDDREFALYSIVLILSIGSFSFFCLNFNYIFEIIQTKNFRTENKSVWSWGRYIALQA